LPLLAAAASPAFQETLAVATPDVRSRAMRERYANASIRLEGSQRRRGLHVTVRSKPDREGATAVGCVVPAGVPPNRARDRDRKDATPEERGCDEHHPRSAC